LRALAFEAELVFFLPAVFFTNMIIAPALPAPSGRKYQSNCR
jgi:hypothetical protein